MVRSGNSVWLPEVGIGKSVLVVKMNAHSSIGLIKMGAGTLYCQLKFVQLTLYG